MDEQRLNEIKEIAAADVANNTYQLQLHILELVAAFERLKETNQQLTKEIFVHEKRFEETDLAIQELENAFTPYERNRFDIRYTHIGIIKGAVRAIKLFR